MTPMYSKFSEFSPILKILPKSKKEILNLLNFHVYFRILAKIQEGNAKFLEYTVPIAEEGEPTN